MRMMLALSCLILSACATAGEEWSPGNPDGFCDDAPRTPVGEYELQIERLDSDCEQPGQEDGTGRMTVGHSGERYYVITETELTWASDVFTNVIIETDGSFDFASHEEPTSADRYSTMRGAFCGKYASAELRTVFPPSSEDWSVFRPSSCFIKFVLQGRFKEVNAGL